MAALPADEPDPVCPVLPATVLPATVLPAAEVLLPWLHADSSEAPPAAAANRRKVRRPGDPGREAAGAPGPAGFT